MPERRTRTCRPSASVPAQRRVSPSLMPATVQRKVPASATSWRRDDSASPLPQLVRARAASATRKGAGITVCSVLPPTCDNPLCYPARGVTASPQLVMGRVSAMGRTRPLGECPEWVERGRRLFRTKLAPDVGAYVGTGVMNLPNYLRKCGSLPLHHFAFRQATAERLQICVSNVRIAGATVPPNRCGQP